MKVNILGQEYEIIKQTKEENPKLEDNYAISAEYTIKEDNAENITWVVNDNGEAVAFKNVKIDKVIEICEILQGDTKKKAKESFKKMKRLEDEINAVLDEIRAEIHATAELHEDGDYYLRDEWIDKIFDKYKAESEDKE